MCPARAAAAQPYIGMATSGPHQKAQRPSSEGIERRTRQAAGHREHRASAAAQQTAIAQQVAAARIKPERDRGPFGALPGGMLRFSLPIASVAPCPGIHNYPDRGALPQRPGETVDANDAGGEVPQHRARNTEQRRRHRVGPGSCREGGRRQRRDPLRRCLHQTIE